jgi:hypothetical protein
MEITNAKKMLEQLHVANVLSKKFGEWLLSNEAKFSRIVTYSPEHKEKYYTIHNSDGEFTMEDMLHMYHHEVNKDYIHK